MRAPVEAAFRGIFERRYFANNGPLVRELDERLSANLGAHAVCVTNESVAFMLLAKALELRGEIVVPERTPLATLSALRFAGLSPAACAVDRRTGMMDAHAAGRVLTPQAGALMGSYAWGRAGDIDALRSVAQNARVPFVLDATQGMGVTGDLSGIPAVFSFHQSTVLPAAEGGCIATTDDMLAQKLRTMRNFAANQTFALVPLRINGKMSEAQAALALIGLEELPTAIASNKRRHDAYARGLADIAGLLVLEADERSNFHYVIADVEEAAFGMSADDLVLKLIALDVGAVRVAPGVLLPNGPRTTVPGIERICATVRQLVRGAL